MKTIKQTIFCIFIILDMNMNAQTDWCGTIMEGDTAFESAFSQLDQNVSMASFLGEERFVLKVHFWDVNDDNGGNEYSLTETQMLNTIAQLNKNFNGFNIFFKYDGKTDLNSTEFQNIAYYPIDGQPQDFLDYQYDNNFYFVGTINIYSVNDISDGIAAYHKKESTSGTFGTIVSEFSSIDDSFKMTHEVAHFFHLLHVFACGFFDNACENVTRDNTDINCYNADIAGDYVIDTNATPKDMDWEPSDCSYSPGIETDECDLAYNFNGLEPEVKNYMSYAHGCQQEFTPGQVVRMRYWIQYWNNHPYITVVKTHPVSILYEPYKGEYYLAGASTSHNPPLFQYGFEYKFYDTSQAEVYNQPSSYGDTSFWYGQTVEAYSVDFNEPNIHNNHTAIVISQLNDYQPRMCYNNYNRSPNDGQVIKFLDGVPNGNYTITPQDSTSINNPALINSLQPGLYNIQKNFEDGTTQQTMILKENN